MCHDHCYFMESKRLGFGFWREEDYSNALKLWGNAQVTRLIHAKGQMNPEEIRMRFDKERVFQSQYGVQYWPVFLKESNEFVGCCGLHPYEKEPFTLEIGAHFLPHVWGTGLAFEASERVIAYCRHHRLAKHLFAGHHPKNQASAKVLSKLGFIYSHDEFYPPTGLMHPSYHRNMLE